MKNIRNFSIIAHIDHGKSTLADRIIQECGSVSDRELGKQMMDTMDIEKERGITIKAQSVRLDYVKDGEHYILNLIDTPGHVDFSYEVSKSLASSDGALLIVDAAQGVEAQTIANVYLAMENNLTLIPVINKIDLPAADPTKVAEEIETSIGIDATDAVLVSAKTGVGIRALIDAIVDRIPAPVGDSNAPTKAIIYDSWFDPYLGALGLVRVFDGEIKVNQLVKIMSNGEEHQVLDLMYPHPLKRKKTPVIKTGEIGIVVLGLKEVHVVNVGDTITDAKNPTCEPVVEYEPAKPFVFAGIYPIDTDEFENLRDALDKLRLNDSSLSFQPETSLALGFGFRVGFLGMLHMEVVKERLEREFNLDLIASAPSVIYKVYLNNGEEIHVHNPSELPEVNRIDRIEEPYIKATVITPSEYLGNIITLLINKRGTQTKMTYLNQDRVMLEYEVPMNEIVMDFYDKLKSISKGYASFDYEPIEFRVGDLVKLDIKVAGEAVDALSIVVPRNQALPRGRVLVKNMKEIIPRQLFEVAVQASLGSQVIARETVKSMGKNVTAKCYGGDITRKRKLLEKQKEGKKRMKSIGKVQLPQEAFMSVLKMD
ncbi:GTP-binding protein LepA [Sulfurimonas denitrificans DSM 1251]|uniref:Elongation factor 4 n=1 Tax=Sulfurimonas denitrificans (strain ATCC 33889 / DSM 1251) TaxID=326298 RepID=LEPA_SULDN|nr:translation elongation factor 4 [Sulfurimonas denitrificans]Q30Q17.1 RecName: Full=Elongation factor 4; Short=EF-4; AltName: Full=Ribosomal back-translocase LepA [Sulfurimonas denitrificans DSM 1251]ABB44914.1 GTP-binding protein LepA [Sulfurimonas denitrificans DSM 1251]MDD3442684.1 translation elongation factor 4 [Sulfurimonas denitrificans]